MKCPYCGAEVLASKCIYCDSDLSDIFTKVNSSIEEKPIVEKPVEEKSDKPQMTAEEKTNAIRELCHKFQKKHNDDSSSYDANRVLIAGKAINKKLYNEICLPAEDEIFLIHDDTLFKNGGNGFAISSSGFYCKEFCVGQSSIKYSEITKDDKTEIVNSVVKLTDSGVSVAYYSGSEDWRKEVCKLVGEILDVVRG